MFTKVLKIILSHACCSGNIGDVFQGYLSIFIENMSMSLIKIYRTPTTTNERLPTEQQNGYHGFATEQFIEGVLYGLHCTSLLLAGTMGC